MAESRPQPVRVLLVDPNDVTRAGLEVLLAKDERFGIMGATAGNALASARRLRPDLIVIDPDVRGQFDIERIATFAAAAPECCICIRTSVFEPRSFVQVMLAGARGYLLKGSARDGFVPDTLFAIGRHGAIVIDPAIGEYFLTCGRGMIVVRAPDPAAERLTDQERVILHLMADGNKDAEIAAGLHVADTTVRTHVRNLCLKLGARTRAHLMRLAEKQGLLSSFAGMVALGSLAGC